MSIQIYFENTYLKAKYVEERINNMSVNST